MKSIGIRNEGDYLFVLKCPNETEIQDHRFSNTLRILMLLLAGFKIHNNF